MSIRYDVLRAVAEQPYITSNCIAEATGLLPRQVQDAVKDARRDEQVKSVRDDVTGRPGYLITEKGLARIAKGPEPIKVVKPTTEDSQMYIEAVNHPTHYTQGGIECIDAIRAALTEEEFKGFCKGNALKYVWRSGKKGDEKEDFKKAAWYLERLHDPVDA